MSRLENIRVNMPDSEKWAWWTIGVLALTVAAYGVFLAFLGHGPATPSVFALLALTSLPASSRRHLEGPSFDEREREIAGKAQLVGFRAFWLAFVVVLISAGLLRGWSGTLTLPVWTISEIICWAFILVVGVEALTTILLYRDGTHA